MYGDLSHGGGSVATDQIAGGHTAIGRMATSQIVCRWSPAPFAAKPNGALTLSSPSIPPPLPASSRQAVCFDVDSTVIAEEGIDVLADFCGAAEAVADLTSR